MRTLLLLLPLTLLAAPARAQEMIEVPTDPHAPPPAVSPVTPRVVDDNPTVVPTVVPPSPSMPLPPPIIAPLPAVEPVDLRDPRRYKRVRNTGLFVAGLMTFGSIYSLNATVGPIFGQLDLAIPIAGPFIVLDAIRKHDAAANLLHDSGLDAGLAIDGILEIAAAAMAIVGATTKHDVFRRQVTLAPSVTRSFAGLALGGRF